MKQPKLANRFRLALQALEDRMVPALFGAIDNAVNAGFNPGAVATADLDGDGKLDLAVVNINSNNVSVFLGNGAGGFSQATGSPIAVGTNPVAIAVGDFNGDGRADLAVANFNIANNSVTVLLGQGNGRVNPAPLSPIPVGPNPKSIAIADLDGDGRQDMAVADSGNNMVSVIRGNGDGTFNTIGGYPTGGNPSCVAVGDLNGDGIRDIVTANFDSNTVSIFRGQGNGVFVPIALIAAGTNPGSLAIADLNHDGHLDVITANVNGHDASVLLGDGTFGFNSAGNVPAGTAPEAIVVADFNGDGFPDAAFPDNANKLVVLIGNGNGDFTPAAGSPFAAGVNPQGIAAGDLNGDGLPDLVCANYTSNDVTVHLNHGATAVTMSSSDKHAVYGQQITLSADVTASSGLPVNGNVLFSYGTGVYGPAPVINGRATLTLPANPLLPAGSYQLKAILMGSAEYFTSTSAPVDQTVAAAPTATTFIGPVKNPAAGQKVNLTAVVTSATGVTPTGTVTFRDGGTVIAADVPLVGDTATVPWTFKSMGNHQFTVQYRETDFNFVSSISPVTPVVVAGTAHKIIVAAGAGGGPHVKVYNTDGSLCLSFDAFNAAFKGGVRVAKGDVNGDGVDDIIVGAGPGGGPHVRVFDGSTGADLRSFFAYAPTFKNGIFVAAGDVDGDGYADIITGAGAGGGPHVRVFSGKTGAELISLQAYDVKFKGGVRVAAADLNGDKKADIIVSPDKGKGQNIRVFDAVSDVGGKHAELFNIQPPFGAKFSGGITVAAGDVTGDGVADLIVSPGMGMGPIVKIFDGANAHAQLGADISAFDSSFNGGVRVATADVDGDGIADIITGAGAGAGGGPHVRVFSGKDSSIELLSFAPYDTTFVGGVYVG